MSSSTASKPKAPMSSHSRFLIRAQSVLLGLVILYTCAILLVMTPFIQTHVVFAHRAKSFGYSKFDHPELYGLAPGKTVDLRLRSADNTTLGAWFIFSDSFYHELPYPPTSRDRTQEIAHAVASRPTILFYHGNTGTRALGLRISLYLALTARLDANVFVVDYRGFADSEGHPTVEGVTLDAYAAWDYLMDKGAKPKDVLILGHSLGTAIAGIVASRLGKEGVQPRGVVLMAPFSSIRAVMDEYYLFGFLPLLRPIASLPGVPRVLTWSLKHKFDTLTLVPNIKSSVLLAHAEDDYDIFATHSEILFEAFLNPHLVATVNGAHTNSAWYETEYEADKLRRQAFFNQTHIPYFGNLTHFQYGGRRVAMLKTIMGSHDLGQLEGVQDTIGREFGLPESRTPKN
ncbi:alpha/beta-hydrolase [Pluteus cervinus]|uniref:Alpha/beta-hydrolase n=1 Tax=Pluteus cervinus TaxID=181527 RepID=A0ACD3AN50_9AGAR|nr:alpha/beta-hydrolase [Pluteus cervinus]